MCFHTKELKACFVKQDTRESEIALDRTFHCLAFFLNRIYEQLNSYKVLLWDLNFFYFLRIVKIIKANDANLIGISKGPVFLYAKFVSMSVFQFFKLIHVYIFKY